MSIHDAKGNAARPIDPRASALALAAKEQLSGLLPAYLGDLAALVNLDSGSHDREDVDQVGAWVRQRTRDWDARIASHPGGEYAESFALTLTGGGTRSIALLCHMDTVFPHGEAARRPFRTEGARAYGPGVCDMKAGIVSAIYAIEALRALAFDGYSQLRLICTTDEEVGSPSSRAFIERETAGFDAALVLEAGRENGDIVCERKGGGVFHLSVEGVMAHAGVEPQKGRSAILSLARLIVALHALNDYPAGKTINVGTVAGGLRPNVVAGEASASVDVRARTVEDMRDLLAAIESALRDQALEETTPTWIQSEEFRPPWGPNAGSAALAAQARGVAVALGFDVVAAATGGMSDGNLTAAIGVPTLDGLAPVGGLDHSPREYVEIESIVPRTALLAGLIAAICLG